ncbi:MAG: hypothetical protein AB1348_05825 [Nitrospirota bacterium]
MNVPPEMGRGGLNVDFIDLVKQSAGKKIIYTLHALDEMKLKMR